MNRQKETKQGQKKGNKKPIRKKRKCNKTLSHKKKRKEVNKKKKTFYSPLFAFLCMRSKITKI
jgi:hypothetical protein